MRFKSAAVRSVISKLLVLVPLSVGTIEISAADSSFAPWGEPGFESYLGRFVEVPLNVFGGIYSRTVAGDQSTLLAWGSVGGAFLLDEPVRDTWQEDFTSQEGDDVSSFFDRSGDSALLLAGLGVSLGTAFLVKDEDLAQTSALALQSFIVAQGGAILTKYTAGRLRPHESGGDSGEWREGSASFFSAHTSGTWSVATVIAHRYSDSRFVPLLAYGWATGVAVSRINDDEHFLSDVVLGSLWGYLVGRSVMGLNPDCNDTLGIAPMSQGDALGLTFNMTF